jgi:D-alanine-D-alanine ligase-like ATP-grasp enzyme
MQAAESFKTQVEKDIIREYLHAHGHTFDMIPAAGESIQMVATANIATGGTAKAYPRDEEDVAFVTGIAHVFGARHIGFDIMTTGHIRDGHILELNCCPTVQGYCTAYPAFEAEYGRIVMDALYI